MGVFISSNFIDLLVLSSSSVVLRCLVPRSSYVHFSIWASSVLSFHIHGICHPMLGMKIGQVGGTLCSVHMSAHCLLEVSCLGMRFVLLPYGIDCLLFLQSHGLKVVWDGNVCSTHFKHLRCGCLQVKCEQLLDEFLVIQGSDESVLDVPFLSSSDGKLHQSARAQRWSMSSSGDSPG